MKWLCAAAVGLAAASGCANAQEISIPPRLGYVPGGTTVVARPQALDCTVATINGDNVKIDWSCVNAYASDRSETGYLARLLKAVHEGRAQ